eukprot:TRINITY_DN117_c0_g1_i1.p1 TRINITY_DN117_c0_g1~~TRINITY_DN117_c0_g1_i1.p1  ORF type:complete len:313 (+),score=58.04 TRINITY_DN117_c0_g1_i1:257-1195(+)
MATLNLDRLIAQLLKCELLGEATVKEVCTRLKEMAIFEPNVQHVQAPVTIVGDLHGQFFDVLEMFRVAGACPDTNFLFLGNYVDRGYYSVETISLLACLKLKYSERITLLRGNHESRRISQVYGFYGECMRKYGNPNVWRYFTEMFDFLAVAAVVDNSVYAVHGGLSGSCTTLDQIRVIDRFKEIPETGPLTDLVWSDPDANKDGFRDEHRSAGQGYGQDTVMEFLRKNGLKHVVRSRQLCMDGYQTLFNDILTTVWSAPNFCYRCGNVAAVMEVSEGEKRYLNTFLAAPSDERITPSCDITKEVPDYYVVT